MAGESEMKSWILLGCVVLLIGVAAAQGVTVHMIGDSTMANKSNPETNPEFGWGQVLQDYFDANQITVQNHARNGRSSKSFVDEGLWESVRTALQPGDYVFIQFGHNDEKPESPERYTNPYTGYRANLVKYIKESLDKGATPVLFTPIVRRNFNTQGTLVDTHGAYPFVVRDVARDMQVAFVDMQWKSEQLVVSLGVEGSKDLYLWLQPGQSDMYPDGHEDNTHFCRKGAQAMAELAIEGIKEDQLPLVNALRMPSRKPPTGR
jgi:lysophospholipase L1-like esterase